VTSPSTFTQRFRAHVAGDDGAADHFFPLLYDEVRRLARRQLRVSGRPGATLNTTALVNEAYLKLVDQTRVSSRERAHFFALVARAMRQIIIDYARRSRASKRGGEARHSTFHESQIGVDDEADVLIALDEAVGRLAELDPRLVQIVECRFFAGMTEEETAASLGVGLRTVQRDWLRARGWLKAELRSEV
jgi:RNA polymerase sigma factor (TIGR02999 family)